MKKTIVLVLVIIYGIFICGCADKRTVNNNIKMLFPPIVPKEIYSLEDNVRKEKARLIVNGKDITEGHHVMAVMKGEKSYFELPLLTILTELGATVEWQTQTKANIYFSDSTYILEADKASFKKKGQTFDMIHHLGGTKNSAYFYLTKNDFILSSERMGHMLSEFGVYMIGDFDELTVTIYNKWQDRGRFWKRR